jgi:hypothetical protein
MTTGNGCSPVLADVILLVHFAFAAFIVLSVPVIWIGFFLKKRFAHNPTFRLAHLLAMGCVLAEALVGMICPLTIWEAALRSRAGNGETYSGSFVQHWVHKILFYEIDQTTFAWIYAGFFAWIVVTMIAVKPHWWWKRKQGETGEEKDRGEETETDTAC